MPSFAQRRQQLIDREREEIREPVHAVAGGYPAAYVELWETMRAGNPAHKQPSVFGLLEDRVGRAGDAYESARRLISRGIGRSELTDMYGQSLAPKSVAGRL